MNEEPSTRASQRDDIDYRLLVPFLTHVTLTQTLILIIRITTSYRALEAFQVLWLGVIATGFAIIPALTALQVGRWIDRGNDARAVWLGSALVFIACIGFWAWPRSAMHLLGFSVLLGFGHMFCMAGHQMLAVRSGGSRSRESVLGYYMVAASIGQGFGPFVVGWLGGSAAVPPTGQLFAVGLLVAAVSAVVALLQRDDRAYRRDEKADGEQLPRGRDRGPAAEPAHHERAEPLSDRGRHHVVARRRSRGCAIRPERTAASGGPPCRVWPKPSGTENPRECHGRRGPAQKPMQARTSTEPTRLHARRCRGRSSARPAAP